MSKITFLSELKLMPFFQYNLSNKILIFDSNLQHQYEKFIQLFPFRIPLQAGEETKELSHVLNLCQKIAHFNISGSPHFIIFGGGSLTDIGGFIASIWNRGSPLSLIPTTYLSAIDSAHGGKTACNLNSIKNKVGTFYSANEIFIVKEIFQALPIERALEAWPEAIKIGIIDSIELYSTCLKLGFKNLYDLLPQCIEAKYKVVNLDPLEKNGTRRLLNLGHTLGHIIESELKLNHGYCVGFGIRFSYEWSLLKGYVQSDWHLEQVPSRKELISVLKKLQNITNYLNQDKKNESGFLNFVFIKKPGEVFCEKVSPSDFIKTCEEILSIG